ncbi:sensor histidine kinase [Devosia albogilva]|uniref:histidine kinase n=1 Tax=Devosia albogilva TaxID=429726 RepID=A0ABW5QHZ5_9HYPH
MAPTTARIAGDNWFVTLRRFAPIITVGVALTLVILAVMAALVLVRGIDGQIADMTRTYDVRNSARELSAALAQAESSQRGYVLTGDPSYLESYRADSVTADMRLRTLTAATEQNAQQRQRVAAIAAEIANKVAEMERSVELVARGQRDAARAFAGTGMGVRLMDEVSQRLEQFIREENQRLMTRNAEIAASRRGLVAAMVAALAGAVVLGYVFFLRARDEVRALASREDHLRSANVELEARVAERTADLEEARAHAERERQRVEALLQETSHRIGNSLATVSSLLALQLMRTPSAEVRQALEAARSRVHAIASAHRRLRLADDLETAVASDFLGAVIDDIQTTSSAASSVEIEAQIDPVVIGARDATTLGILAGELVVNALKHAFPAGRSGTIAVRFALDAAGVPTLVVADDGVGFAPKQDEQDSGLGSVIVRQLASQFGGRPKFEASPGGGLTVTIALPELAKSPPRG